MKTDQIFEQEVNNAFERIGTPVQMHNQIVDAVLGKGDLFSALCDMTRADAKRIQAEDRWEENQRNADREYAYEMDNQ